eukprot:265263_1
MLPTIPSDIAQSKRSLPALPISKRKLPPLNPKLPTLSQSKSKFIIGNNCLESALTPRTPRKSPQTPCTPRRRLNNKKSIRYLFDKVQQKIGPKTKLKQIAPISDTEESEFDITDDEDIDYNKSLMRSTWRPDLQHICDDNELLHALITFMTKQYNQENILFLQAVHKLNNNIRHILLFSDEFNIVKVEKINVQIKCIYNQYILNNAAQQVNLASECFINIMNIHQRFTDFTLTQKSEMFAQCCNEISNLIKMSVLPSFYNSNEFQSIARDRNIYNSNDSLKRLFDNGLQISDNADWDSDDIEYENTDDSYKMCFDVHSCNKWRSNYNKYMLCSNGFDKNSGCHEWSIQIVKCGDGRQEFGVISNFNKNIQMKEYGILDTALFGARCVYGYNKLNRRRNNFYYASYNSNNNMRCNKDLSQLNIHQMKWKSGDIIKICLDLTKGMCKFFLNGQKVRKTISIEKNNIYYPIILYSGDCEYKVIE